MEQNVQRLMEWLEAQPEASLVIEKQELDDLDTVHFNLNSVDYRNADDVIDEYLSSALILRGSGSTLNADGELVPLPQPSYEIAVNGLKVIALAEDHVELQTDRAKYSLVLRG
ncbi:hypothetical protein [Paenibacillus sp. MMS20-IR301]|uniref:hypothetical protein n=1 Tax=Paenibacillus sp. MMS20-IR301 TaxID=2895946 RepID=UPI0028EB42C8|nr:hypothetical protein [Paenibacillus sp. MMS20-IR301]WNS45078.1 hypothetical protein LOS79_07365 [Paenibacillus sp. MMS20-IR301]